MAPPFRGKHPPRKNTNKPQLGEFDLEKARHEVFMLGIKGFKHKDKQEAKKELAIRLGAIPKKKRGKNIKQHMEEVRERKRKEQEERQERANMGEFDMASRRPKSSSGGKHDDKRKKKGLNEVREMDYQIGRFKDGVQFLSKEDITRLKRRTR